MEILEAYEYGVEFIYTYQDNILPYITNTHMNTNKRYVEIFKEMVMYILTGMSHLHGRNIQTVTVSNIGTKKDRYEKHDIVMLLRKNLIVLKEFKN